MPARHLRIYGRVQGVGFRYAMVYQARALQLAGWVRNRSDGSVEAVAVGSHAALDQFQAWAERGPSGSNVDAVETRAATDDETSMASEQFGQLPTI